MRKFTKAAAMLCAAAMVIPSASVFAAEDGGASELTEVHIQSVRSRLSSQCSVPTCQT